MNNLALIEIDCKTTLSSGLESFFSRNKGIRGTQVSTLLRSLVNITDDNVSFFIEDSHFTKLSLLMKVSAQSSGKTEYVRMIFDTHIRGIRLDTPIRITTLPRTTRLDEIRFSKINAK